MDEKHDHSDLIDRLGGTVKAAELFEVRSQSVSQWRRTGIPRARLMFLRAVKPELFGGVSHVGDESARSAAA